VGVRPKRRHPRASQIRIGQTAMVAAPPCVAGRSIDRLGLHHCEEGPRKLDLSASVDPPAISIGAV